MYIEFYGLPGAGKTTFAEKFNKILNKDSRENYSPLTILKTIFAFSKFMVLVLLKMITSISFLIAVINRPLHFMAFVKGMLVRFIVVFRHEKSGVFISDHGLIQTPSQNSVFRKALIEDKLFLCRILSTFPRKRSVQYIHLKSETELSMKRVLTRERYHVFSQEFLIECSILFKYAQNFFKSTTIRTDIPLKKMENIVETILKKKRFMLTKKR